MIWHPCAIVNNNGAHFCNRSFDALMRKIFITYMLVIPYHSQTSEQVVNTNHQLK